MELLKLVALDGDDLAIVSAHVQDAVLKVADIEFWKKKGVFVLPMYRFAQEKAPRLSNPNAERRNSVLTFGRVRGVRAQGIPRDRPDTVLSLLALRFEESDAPAGSVDLAFSGGGTIRLDVECVEASLADLGGAWAASSRPRHTF
ncbi:MAG: DUF2948 family protein [Rhizobiaceae bacterium]